MPVYVPGVTFTDFPAGHWAEGAIAEAYNRGLVAGYPEPDGTVTLRGDQSPTRIEQIVFFMRLLAYLPANLQVVHDPLVTLPDDPAFAVSADAHNKPHKVEIPA